MREDMEEPELVFVADDGGIVVNFGVFSGREATQAELDRLAQELLADVDAGEIVAEQHLRFDRRMEGSVYQVRVEIPEADGARRDAALTTVDDWARSCIAERRLATP
jgi:hypothetical protein